MATAPKSSGGIGARLTRKVGPLPVWAWAVAILVVGYVAYKKYSGSSTASTAASQTTPVPVTPDVTGTDTAGSVGSGTDTSSGSAQSNLTPDLLGQIYSTNAAEIDSLTNALVNLSALQATPIDQGGPPGASISPPQAPGSTTGSVGGVQPRGTVLTTPTPQGYAAAYNPTTGVTYTPTGGAIKPTVAYSSPSAAKPVKGPSIFAFK